MLTSIQDEPTTESCDNSSRHAPIVRRVSIPSRRERVRLIHDEVLAGLENYDFTPADQYAVELSLEEALINAIKHGNGLNPAKEVRLEFRINGREAWFRIEDEGGGFRVEDVPDPTLPEYIDRPSGRGVLLMRSFMDRVDYSPRGNVVTMWKFRSTASNTL